MLESFSEDDEPPPPKTPVQPRQPSKRSSSKKTGETVRNERYKDAEAVAPGGTLFTLAPASTFSSCKGSSVGLAAANESNVSSDRVEFRETTNKSSYQPSPLVSRAPRDSLIYDIRGASDMVPFSAKTSEATLNGEETPGLRGTGSFTRLAHPPPAELSPIHTESHESSSGRFTSRARKTLQMEPGDPGHVVAVESVVPRSDAQMEGELYSPAPKIVNTPSTEAISPTGEGVILQIYKESAMQARLQKRTTPPPEK